MVEKTPLRNQRRNKKIKLIIIVCTIILVLTLINFTKEKINQRKIDRQIRDLEQQINDVERSNLEINNYIAMWQSGNSAEKEARLKLGLKKAGESVIIVNRPQNNTSTVNQIGAGAEIVGNIIKENNRQTQSNPVLWWHYFFKN